MADYIIGGICLLFAIAVGLKWWRSPAWFELERKEWGR